MTFATLGLDSALLHAVAKQGFIEPTPVQIQAIPAILKGRDVQAAARTGSGKTAAFALPLLQQLLSSNPSPRSPEVLVLAPTRELATQIGDVFRSFARNITEPIKITVATGGVSINPQMLSLRGSMHAVIATPGRLLDLVEQNAIKLSAIKTLVLDEADRMLDLGFTEELQRILKLLPKQRQNLLFSATFPENIQALSAQLLHQPILIQLTQDSTPAPAIVQRAITVDQAKRTPLLRYLLNSEQWSRVLVFVATKYATEHVADKLRRNQINAAAFHGELSQGARTHALTAFKSGQLQVLVATDLAGRGIDIEQLPVVVNYDLPRSTEDYTHRIGRTARAGASGIVVNFITAENEAHFRLIEKRQNIRLPREHLAGFEPTAVIQTTTDRHGGIKGKRKSKKDKLREAVTAKANPPKENNTSYTPPTASFVWPTKPIN
jgi:hypothetical protein